MKLLILLLRLRSSGNDHIYNSVIFSLFRGHDKIPVDISLNLISGLIRVFDQNIIYVFSYPHDFLSLDRNIGSLALETTKRLMKNNPGIGKRITFARCPRG